MFNSYLSKIIKLRYINVNYGKNTFLFFFLGAIFFSCSGSQSKKDSKSSIEIPVELSKSFVLPEIPSVLTTSTQRSEFLVIHYWDNFNFADTVLITRADITEQAFVDYITLFPHTDMDVIDKSVSEVLQKSIDGSPEMFHHFVELYEKYLYNPNSPFRNEEFYILVLRAIINNDKVDDIFKARPQYVLEMALKNRVGDIAKDFDFIMQNGKNSSLQKTKSDYVILFFNNPDCYDCLRVKEILSQIKDTKIKIVAIYVDEDKGLWEKSKYPSDWVNGYAPILRTAQYYDLRAIPNLYLLDNDKRVILKDAPIEQILQLLLSKEKLNNQWN